MRRAAAARLSAVLALAAMACGPKTPPAADVSSHDEAPRGSREPANYAFDPLDEQPVSSDAMRGKPTVLVFITTGDIIGQAQVSYLVHMAKADGGRVHYAAVALHPRKEIVLVEAYRRTLGVEFPVALGDPTALHAGGPFGDIPAVPTLVVLDRDGRVVWKHTGLVKPDEIRAHLADR